MSQGLRPVPAARLAFAFLTLPLALALLPPSASAAPPRIPDSELGRRIAPLLLLSRADVRVDVGLDEAQAADAARVVSELHQRASSLAGKKADPGVEASQRAIDEAAERWLKSRLTRPQLKRLIEIDLQWEGPSALISRPIITDHVGVTPEQKAGLAKAVAAYHQERARPGDLRGSVGRLAKQTEAILTPEQLERWYAMLGRRFSPQLADSSTVPPVEAGGGA